MKRLTERYSETEKPDGESDVWVRNHDYIMAAERLADYEDTGLTPQEIMELKMMTEIPQICCDEYCKYPDRCWQFELKDICDGCKLANLFDLLVDK